MEQVFTYTLADIGNRREAKKYCPCAPVTTPLHFSSLKISLKILITERRTKSEEHRRHGDTVMMEDASAERKVEREENVSG